MRLSIGNAAPPFEAYDLDGERLALGGRRVLLSFLRYASCPMCLLRIDELMRAAPSLQTAGIEVVVVLHSPRERILGHVHRSLPLRIVADPGRRLYRLYGVESSWRRLLWSTLQPTFYTRWAAATMRGYFGGAIDGEFARMPADFLISPDGRIERAHYGAAIGDHIELGRITEGIGVPT